MIISWLHTHAILQMYCALRYIYNLLTLCLIGEMSVDLAVIHLMLRADMKQAQDAKDMQSLSVSDMQER